MSICTNYNKLGTRSETWLKFFSEKLLVRQFQLKVDQINYTNVKCIKGFVRVASK